MTADTLVALATDLLDTLYRFKATEPDSEEETLALRAVAEIVGTQIAAAQLRPAPLCRCAYDLTFN